MNKNPFRGIALYRSHLCGAVQRLMLYTELTLQTLLLIFVWDRYYNTAMPVPIYYRGYYALALFYWSLLFICTKALKGRDIGDMRLLDTIISQSIALVLGNCAAYFPLCLLSYRIINPNYLLCMLMGQICVVVFWCFLCTRLVFFLFRPLELLLVGSEESRRVLKKKLDHYRERYHISAELSDTTSRGELFMALRNCHAVLLDTPDRELRDYLSIQCFRRNLFIFIVPDIQDVILHASKRLHIVDTPLLRTDSHRITASDRVVKRLMDVGVSALGLLISAPFLLLSAAAIYLEDRGPVFFTQERLTLDGKVFRIVKLRTMVTDAEKNGQKLAEKNDPRITRVGAFLRKTRLDELPQLWNVLKGDMSLVGPRPECPSIAEEYQKKLPEFRYRLKVKAGITGMAQVYGSYGTSPRDKLLMDLMYIEEYTVSLDVTLLLLTVRTLFLSEKTEGVEVEEEKEA